MSIKDVKMYEELLALLEERYDEGEIDKQSYYELKRRYLEKLEKAKKLFEEEKELGNIAVSGFKTLTNNELSIAGSAKIVGGRIMREIRIAGSGKIDHNLECLALHSAGSLKVHGNLTVHRIIRTAGSFVCEGTIMVGGDVNCTGSVKVEQSIMARGAINLSGAIKVEGHVESENDMRLSGSVHVEGNLTSKSKIEIKGKANIEGNITCRDLLISSKSTVFESLFFKHKSKSKIEGDINAIGELYLQDVHVEGDVKGNIVRIGPNTKIEGKVYYIAEVYVDNDSKLEHKPIKISENAF